MVGICEVISHCHLIRHVVDIPEAGESCHLPVNGKVMVPDHVASKTKSANTPRVWVNNRRLRSPFAAAPPPTLLIDEAGECLEVLGPGKPFSGSWPVNRESPKTLMRGTGSEVRRDGCGEVGGDKRVGEGILVTSLGSVECLRVLLSPFGLGHVGVRRNICRGMIRMFEGDTSISRHCRGVRSYNWLQRHHTILQTAGEPCPEPKLAEDDENATSCECNI